MSFIKIETVLEIVDIVDLIVYIPKSSITSFNEYVKENKYTIETKECELYVTKKEFYRVLELVNN